MVSWVKHQLKRFRRSQGKLSTRLKKQTRYKSFRLSTKLKSDSPSLMPIRLMLKQSLEFALKYRWRLLAHGLIFIIFYGVLVFGFSQQLDLTQIRQDLSDSLGGGFNAQLVAGLSLLSQLFSGGTQAFTGQGSIYPLLLFAMMSLATIWLIRSLKESPNKLRARDAYYFGPAQFVPFAISLVVIALQLLPMLIINQVASSLRDNQVLLTGAEQALVVSLVLLLNLLSVYLVSGSVFSLMVVSLPGARPFQALQSSFNITRYRRWLVVRYILVALLALTITTMIIMLPVLLLATSIAEYTFYFVYVLGFIFAHIYFYHLYRELIK